ncbi:GP5 protein [Pebjah virus]|uniref:GP5 protein n=1 Tax=Pebjah virus TaxID=1658615 RepID=A0A0G2UH72_9NIDO|nr:GP5 protein [Pebjah virus]AKI29935.1 GP5 protein [Pebjah virus]AKI29950.1 GP5 protein [Pebjah virus]AKI29965.1 GP5 protein [Pebjah virus]
MYISVLLSLTLLLSSTVTRCVSSDGDVKSYAPSSWMSKVKEMILEPSYVVNISICGAFDIQNNTHWFRPCDSFKQNITGNCNNETARCSAFLNNLPCMLHNYTGSHINHTQVLLETYLAVPLLTHLLSYYAATTASFLDFTFFGMLAGSAYYYFSPSFFFFAPLALIFLCIFLRRIITNCMALRYAWTRHTNFIIDQKGRLFVNHDDVLVSDQGQVKLGDHRVVVAKVILGGREAQLLRESHVEEWAW